MQLCQGKEVRYSFNSPTWALLWIWPKWPKEGFRAPWLRKRNIWSKTSRRSPRKEESGSWVSWVCQCELLGNNTRLCFGKIKRTTACFVKLAQHRMPRHAGCAKHWCTSSRVTWQADTKTKGTSTRNAACSPQWQWGSSHILNWSCATRIWVFRSSLAQRSIVESWCICEGSQAW